MKRLASVFARYVGQKKERRSLGCGLLSSYLPAYRFTDRFLTNGLAGHFASDGLASYLAASLLANRLASHLAAYDFAGYFTANRLAGYLTANLLANRLANRFTNQRAGDRFSHGCFAHGFLSNCHYWLDSSFLWPASDQGYCLPYTVLAAPMQVLAEDGARIDVHVSGDKRAPAVVLLHGFPLTRNIWDAQAELLAESHFVVLPDLRGAGASSAPQGPYLIEMHAADIAAVLDSLNVERAAFVGHSMGGYVTLAFARMFTERVTGIALIASRLRADTPQEAAARYDLAALVESEQNIEPVIATYLPRMLSQRTRIALPAIAERAYEIARRNAPRGVAATLRGLAMRVSGEDIAEDLDLPMVMVTGGDDAVIGMEEARAVAERFPRGRLAVCAHSGHLPMMEEPACVQAALAEWLEAAGASG